MTTLTTEQQILCDLCQNVLSSGMEVVSGHKTGYYELVDGYGHITFADYAELFLCNTCQVVDPQWVNNYRILTETDKNNRKQTEMNIFFERGNDKRFCVPVEEYLIPELLHLNVFDKEMITIRYHSKAYDQTITAKLEIVSKETHKRRQYD